MLGYCRDRNTELESDGDQVRVRALLRFLHVAGPVPVALAGVAPGLIARALEDVVVQRLGRRRDYAVLTMLARLGVRGAEAADLKLDDVD
jgi:hypothetical protein